MRPHFLHAQPALLFAGAAAFCDLAHQADGRLRFFVITQLLWFVCLVPLITAIIGAVRQSDLPKNIGRDAGMIVAQMG